MVLLTDGTSNYAYEDQADAFREKDYIIFGIGVGKNLNIDNFYKVGLCAVCVQFV